MHPSLPIFSEVIKKHLNAPANRKLEDYHPWKVKIMRTPTLIGGILFGTSFLFAAIAIIRPNAVEPSLTTDIQYFELFFIWLSGIIAGVALGISNRESDYMWGENNQIWTLIGGMAFIGIFILAFWFLLLKTVVLPAIVVAVIAAILAFVGLFFAVVSMSTE